MQEACKRTVIRITIVGSGSGIQQDDELARPAPAWNHENLELLGHEVGRRCQECPGGENEWQKIQGQKMILILFYRIRIISLILIIIILILANSWNCFCKMTL